MYFFTAQIKMATAGITAAIVLTALVLAPAELQATDSEHSADRYELRGILDLGKRQSFSLHDLETGNTFWLKLGGFAGDILAKSYDASEKVLTLEVSGMNHRLRLATAGDQPLEVMTNSLMQGKHEARQAWVTSPVANPRLTNTIRQRRASGAIPAAVNVPESRSSQVASLDADRLLASSQNSTNSSQQIAEASVGEGLGLNESSTSKRNVGSPLSHGNPRVLAARAQQRVTR